MRIALWGGFDVANFGDLLFPKIFEHELLRRLPGAEITFYAPLGSLLPEPMKGAERALPLGVWSQKVCERFAGEFDLIGVGGGDIIHTHDQLYPGFYGMNLDALEGFRPSRFYIEGLGPELERRCPVFWNAVGVPFAFEGIHGRRVANALASKSYIAVRDRASRERLLSTGFKGQVAVVPDTALLMARLFPPGPRAERLETLRARCNYPAPGTAMVIQGNGYLPVKTLDEVARQLDVVLRADESVVPVLLEIGSCHGDGHFADEMEVRLCRPVHRLSSEWELADIAAAIAGARLFVGTSLHGHIAAFCFGVPGVILHFQGLQKLYGFAESVQRQDFLVDRPQGLSSAVHRALASERRTDPSILRSLVRQVDAHFDRVAALAGHSGKSRSRRPKR